MRLTKEQLSNFTSWDDYVITLKPKVKNVKTVDKSDKPKLDDEAKRVRQAGYMRKYYEKNRPVILEKLKKHYHEGKADGESQKEKQSKYYKQYYQLHKEEILARLNEKRHGKKSDEPK